MPYLFIFLALLIIIVVAAGAAFSHGANSNTDEECEVYGEDEKENIKKDVSGGEIYEEELYDDAFTADLYSDFFEENNNLPEPSSEEKDYSNNNYDKELEAMFHESDCTEFDILIKGTFYLRGTSTDSKGETQPAVMAIDKDSAYAEAMLGAAYLGVLATGNNIYMIYHENKSYLKLSPTIMKLMGLNPAELISAKAFHFDGVTGLPDAKSSEDSVFNEQDCKCYIFDKANGCFKFYVNGSKLLGFSSENANGDVTSSTVVDFITDDIPADKKAPPEGYKAHQGIPGTVAFMNALPKENS